MQQVRSMEFALKVPNGKSELNTPNILKNTQKKFDPEQFVLPL